jgi:hypothetical protein
MKKLLLFASLLLVSSVFSDVAFSQNNVGIGTTTPDNSAILDISSLNRGVLIPRMATAAMLGVPSPSNGLIIYNTDSLCYCYWNTSAWVSLCNGVGGSGSQGATGATGVNGATGADGATGATGADGATGATGADGATGVDGATGATGDVGPTGPAGGPVGPTGADGATGATGADGATGAVGATGPSGADGATGAVGATGPSGADGATGSAGATGATGATGPSGAANVQSVALLSQSQLTVGDPGGTSIVYTQIPDLTYTFTVPAGETWNVFAHAFGTTLNLGPNFTDCSSQWAIFVNGTATSNLQRITLMDGSSQLVANYEGWGVSYTGQFTAGTYTIDARGAWAGDGDGTCQVYLGGASGSFQSALNLLITQ